MTLEQQIQEAIKEAMKAKDTVALSANRAIKGEILLFKTSEGGAKEVTDGDILKMIQKAIFCNCHRKLLKGERDI